MMNLNGLVGTIDAGLFSFLQGLKAAVQSVVITVASAYDMAVGQKDYTDANAAAVSQIIPFFRARQNNTVTGLRFLTTTTVPTNGTDFAILNVYRIRAGATALIGTINTSAVAWTTEIDTLIVLNTANAGLLPGDYLALQIDKGGAGQVTGALAVSVQVLPF
jgi:uncharacterized membrane protein YkvI